MPDRRRDKRFRLTEPADGALRIFPDVSVQPNGENEWIAMSREAAITGETLILEIVTLGADAPEQRQRLPVYVIDSRPVIIDGDLWHRIRLYSGQMASVMLEQRIRRG
jgi:hypothetical protein